MSARILLVEDEPGVVLILTDLLEAEGYAVEVSRDGPAGLQRASETGFDLLILDVGLPGMDGLQLCHAVRERGFDGAILMLTARGEVPDRVQGLRHGADDYLGKPYDPDELLARLGALLRRSRREALVPVLQFEFGNVKVDFDKGMFWKNRRPLALAAKETELLRLLINHRGQVLTRDNILHQVWKEQPFITPRTVDVHVAWLRQKLEDQPQSPVHILTVRGVGYRFQV